VLQIFITLFSYVEPELANIIYNFINEISNIINISLLSISPKENLLLIFVESPRPLSIGVTEVRSRSHSRYCA